jgi:ring-1,2-phenylacetyl-CoA epoxidase subunit PaaC
VWLDVVTPVLIRATLAIPQNATPVFGGRRGQHTSHLADLLSEMQKVARMEAPEAVW